MQKRKSILEHKKFILSVRHACRGVGIAFREEQNIRIHALCALAVFALAALVKVNGFEFIMLSISITLVLVIELVNSIVERFSDMVKPQVSHLIAAVKDMSAAAVLICSGNAVIVGSVIFFPRFFLFIQKILFLGGG
ncbi:diacylglycerol kinase family protein [Candidatus Uhrbacteria bacterium]|nr:diacylglycerol kinase family protein [Candidatus Uhrbacteria bacterium]